jgi:hypothetical protein
MHSKAGTQRVSERLLKVFLSDKGYRYVFLRTHTRRTVRFKIGRLVLSTFVGTNPEKPFACHRNGDRVDDRLENLYWGTQLENIHDAIRHGTFIRGDASSKSKLTSSEVLELRQLHAGGVSQAELVRRLSGRVSQATVSRLLRGRNWADVPFPTGTHRR